MGDVKTPAHESRCTAAGAITCPCHGSLCCFREDAIARIEFPCAGAPAYYWPQRLAGFAAWGAFIILDTLPLHLWEERQLLAACGGRFEASYSLIMFAAFPPAVMLLASCVFSTVFPKLSWRNALFVADGALAFFVLSIIAALPFAFTAVSGREASILLQRLAEPASLAPVWYLLLCLPSLAVGTILAAILSAAARSARSTPRFQVPAGLLLLAGVCAAAAFAWHALLPPGISGCRMITLASDPGPSISYNGGVSFQESDLRQATGLDPEAQRAAGIRVCPSSWRGIGCYLRENCRTGAAIDMRQIAAGMLLRGQASLGRGGKRLERLYHVTTDPNPGCDFYYSEQGERVTLLPPGCRQRN